MWKKEKGKRKGTEEEDCGGVSIFMHFGILEGSYIDSIAFLTSTLGKCYVIDNPWLKFLQVPASHMPFNRYY